jgi:hypothetical protein
MPHKIVGKRRGGEPQDEREHFIKCPACGRWIDMRDLGMSWSTSELATGHQRPGRTETAR